MGPPTIPPITAPTTAPGGPAIMAPVPPPIAAPERVRSCAAAAEERTISVAKVSVSFFTMCVPAFGGLASKPQESRCLRHGRECRLNSGRGATCSSKRERGVRTLAPTTEHGGTDVTGSWLPSEQTPGANNEIFQDDFAGSVSAHLRRGSVRTDGGLRSRQSWNRANPADHEPRRSGGNARSHRCPRDRYDRAGQYVQHCTGRHDAATSDGGNTTSGARPGTTRQRSRSARRNTGLGS